VAALVPTPAWRLSPRLPHVSFRRQPWRRNYTETMATSVSIAVLVCVLPDFPLRSMGSLHQP
jgi:hypothetical protein